MPEASRFKATRRPGLDEAAVFRTSLVDGARETIRDRNIERAAPMTRVLNEAPPRWAMVEHRVFGQQIRAKTLVVALKQMHRAGLMVAAATAGHAVIAIRVGHARDRGQKHDS